MGLGDGRWFRREGTYIYLWLIYADVWQRPTQYSNAIILKFKKRKKKKKSLYHLILKKYIYIYLSIYLHLTLSIV